MPRFRTKEEYLRQEDHLRRALAPWYRRLWWRVCALFSGKGG